MELITSDKYGNNERRGAILVTKRAPCSALGITMPRHIVFEGPDIFYLTRLMYTGNSCLEILSDVTRYYFPLPLWSLWTFRGCKSSFAFSFFFLSPLYRVILVIISYLVRMARDARKLWRRESIGARGFTSFANATLRVVRFFLNEIVYFSVCIIGKSRHSLRKLKRSFRKMFQLQFRKNLSYQRRGGTVLFLYSYCRVL